MSDQDPFVALLGWLVHQPQGGDGSLDELARRSRVKPRTLHDWSAGKYPRDRNTAPVAQLHRWALENVRSYPPPDCHGVGLVQLSGPDRVTSVPSRWSGPETDVLSSPRDAVVSGPSEASPRAESGRRRRVWIAAGAALGLLAVAAVIVGLSRRTTHATGDPAPRAHVPAGPSIAEYSDNRKNGTPVYASPAGKSVGALVPATIPYGTLVHVRCRVANQTGAASVTALYLIADTQWKGLYAVSDTMTNGDPLGASGGHAVDARVPACV